MSSWEVEEAVRSAVPTSAGWARAACPFCEEATGKVDAKKSFSVSMETGYWQCFKCEEKGWLEGPPSVEDAPVQRRRSVNRSSDTDIPPGSVLLASRDGRTAMALEQARSYMLDVRRFDWAALVHYRIHACLDGYYANRIIFPVQRNGNVVGFVARSWSKTSERAYLYPRGFDRGVFFNGDELRRETDQPLFVVEGVFDAMRVGPNAIACLGKPTTAQVEQLSKLRHRPVIVALDADAWRIGMTTAMTLKLRGVKAVDLRLPPGKDPDSLSEDWFREKAAKRLTDQ